MDRSGGACGIQSKEVFIPAGWSLRLAIGEHRAIVLEGQAPLCGCYPTGPSFVCSIALFTRARSWYSSVQAEYFGRVPSDGDLDAVYRTREASALGIVQVEIRNVRPAEHLLYYRRGVAAIANRRVTQYVRRIVRANRYQTTADIVGDHARWRARINCWRRVSTSRVSDRTKPCSSR